MFANISVEFSAVLLKDLLGGIYVHITLIYQDVW